MHSAFVQTCCGYLRDQLLMRSLAIMSLGPKHASAVAAYSIKMTGL